MLFEFNWKKNVNLNITTKPLSQNSNTTSIEIVKSLQKIHVHHLVKRTKHLQDMSRDVYMSMAMTHPPIEVRGVARPTPRPEGPT